MLSANNTERKSWINYDNNCDFPIQNIPFGVFKTNQNDFHIATIIGETVISIKNLEKEGYFNKIDLAEHTFQEPNLNKFLEHDKSIWRKVRNKIAEIFDIKNNFKSKILNQNILFNKNIEMVLPVKIGDYTDFYSSKDHATNVGKMFRDPENALLPNWLHIPVGYHGRSSSIVISGTDVKRPSGQILNKESNKPIFSKSKLLDFELEMAFITGKSNKLGESIDIEKAEDYIFGLCLFNDWSARDIQKWEYVPLGPFLGKSFNSSISPWIVTLDALEPFRIAGEKQVPEVLDYLKFNGDKNFNVELEVQIKSLDSEPTTVSKSNFKYMYWNMAQQLTHHAINGCNIKAGDLMASGTISGPNKSEFGSMLEISWAGKESIYLNNGEERKFLKDGDTVIMKGYSQNKDIRIGFGKLSNKII
ncbi:MAG: fumarylacetoacetase [Flavobacteriales bacterium]|nr:fumarylacetoacetase [Flavobacteriales bacterium]|tara:strand:- start:13431 stop:14684 length:1254 start_codon:yes stop_codon:yes gene_type:complete